jgi:hypothetical protein
MAAAPAAELTKLDAIRVVPPVLAGLVIAPLALLTRKRHLGSNFSASHSSRLSSAMRRTRKDRACERGCH